MQITLLGYLIHQGYPEAVKLTEEQRKEFAQNIEHDVYDNLYEAYVAYCYEQSTYNPYE